MYSNEWGRDNYDNYDDLKLKKTQTFHRFKPIHSRTNFQFNISLGGVMSS